MANNASRIPSDEDATSTQYNNLVADIEEHTHDGSDTAQVDHTDLSSVGSNTHAEIDTHTAAEGYVDTNVHGCDASNENIVISKTSSQQIMYYGQEGPYNLSNAWVDRAISFGATLPSTPHVQVTPVVHASDWNTEYHWSIHSVTTTGFTFRFRASGVDSYWVNWMAICDT